MSKNQSNNTIFKHFLIMLLLGLLTGCSKNTQRSLNPEPAVIDRSGAVDPASFTPRFDEGDCPFDVPSTVPAGKLVCGMVTVPEDHRRPDGPTIRLAVAVFKDVADPADHQPDPLLVLAGGPGQKLLSQAIPVAELLEPLHPGRDLILYDQRGVGFSEPALDCPEFVAVLISNMALTDADQAAHNSYDALLTCRDRLQAEGHHLAAFTTWQSAADVEMIRRALGYETLNVYGGSYGSLLAQAVMRDHPQPIRSVIMDSIWPLEKSFFIEVASVSSEAILHMIDRCAADVDCDAAYPDLEEAFFTVIDRLNQHPVPIKVTHPLTGDSYRAFLTGDVVLGNMRTFMYDTEAIPVLPQAIYEVYEGEYDLMSRMTSIRLIGFDRLSTGMELSVACTDDLIGRTLTDYFAVLDELPPQLQGSSSREAIQEYGIMAICNAWPVEPADPWIREPVSSDLPTLLLSGEFDPVTPPQYAPLVEAHLSHSYAFEFPGVGHSPLGSSACAQEIFRAFLNDPLSRPADRCLADYDVDFAVPADYDISNLEPVEVAEFGIRSVAPAGWRQVEPGVFASPDFAQIFYLLKIDMALETFIEENDLEGPLDKMTINGRVWQLYESQPLDPGSIGLDIISVIDDGRFYDVAIITPAPSRDLIEKNLLQPALEAFSILNDPH